MGVSAASHYGGLSAPVHQTGVSTASHGGLSAPAHHIGVSALTHLTSTVTPQYASAVS